MSQITVAMGTVIQEMTTTVTKAASAAQHAAHTLSRAEEPDPFKAHRKNSSSKYAHR